MAVEQIRVHVGLGDSWQLTPEIAWKVKDEEGMGEVTQVRIAMRQADVRSWTRPQQETALRSAVALSVLAVLPADHLSRPTLADAATAGAGLLPTDG